MEKPKFEFYTRPNGHNEFLEFYNNLPLKDQQKLLATINRIEKDGLLIAQRLELVKKLDYEIYEIRSKHSNNIQRALYFHVNHNKYIVTHGFTKKTQKTPSREIQRAKVIKFDEFLAEQRKNPSFENGFLKEDAKLENAIALLRARENAGLSQRELAERSGVPQSTIARIERGYNTSIDTLSKIAFALNKRVKISFI